MTELKTEKEKKVHQTFENIASVYDKMNHVISFSMQTRWKRDFVYKIGIRKNQNVLDVCCGTGDMSFLMKEYGAEHVTGIDFSESMLECAKKRCLGQEKNISFIKGNAMELPFEDNRFDHTVISFGLRNTPDYTRVIREMIRVTKKGGSISCLDTSHPQLVGFKQLYWIYFKHIMPFIGGLFVKRKSDYEWLYTSSQSFLSKDDLRNLFLSENLKGITLKSYAAGAVIGVRGVKR